MSIFLMVHHWGCDISGMWPKSSRSSPSRSVWLAKAWMMRSVPRCVTWVRWSRRCLSTRRSCPSIPHISTWLRTAWNSTRDMWINSARSNRWVCYWCYKKKIVWTKRSVFDAHWQCSRKGFFSDHQTCPMILSKSADILKILPDISLYVLTKSFSDDQTICLMILNKSSNILQNHQQCLMGQWLFVNTALKIKLKMIFWNRVKCRLRVMVDDTLFQIIHHAGMGLYDLCLFNENKFWSSWLLFPAIYHHKHCCCRCEQLTPKYVYWDKHNVNAVKCHYNACHYNANASLTRSILGSQTAPTSWHALMTIPESSGSSTWAKGVRSSRSDRPQRQWHPFVTIQME